VAAATAAIRSERGLRGMGLPFREGACGGARSSGKRSEVRL
jgi:hypothetical protein